MIDINTLKIPVYDDIAVEGQWFSSLGVYVAGTDGIELSLLPAKNITQTEIMGLSGASYSSGRFEPREIPLPIYISDISMLEDFKKLIMFTEPKWIYFKNTNTKIKGVFTNAVKGKFKGIRGTFDLVLMALDPYFYEVIPFNITYTNFVNPILLNNTGNSNSFPVYEVTGKGTVVVGVNGQVMTLRFNATVYETLVVNAKTCEVKLGNNNRFYSLDESDIPMLLSGQNTIDVTGNCTMLKVIPNNRWI